MLEQSLKQNKPCNKEGYMTLVHYNVERDKIEVNQMELEMNLCLMIEVEHGSCYLV